MIWAITQLEQHHPWSGWGPVQSIVRCHDDDSFGFTGEKKQAWLVLPRLILLPVGHSLGLVCSWKNCPCVICFPSQFNGICFKENKFRLTVTPWLWPCTAFRLGPRVCRWNDWVRQSNLLGSEKVCSASSMRDETCVHLAAPSASWQPPCRKFWVKCRIHNPICVLLLLILISNLVNWIQLIQSWAVSQRCTSLTNVHLSSLATWRLRWWRGSRIFVVSLCWNEV